jgi:hypothetical protein
VIAGRRGRIKGSTCPVTWQHAHKPGPLAQWATSPTPPRCDLRPLAPPKAILRTFERSLMFERKEGKVYSADELAEASAAVMAARHAEMRDAGKEIAKLLSASNRVIKVPDGSPPAQPQPLCFLPCRRSGLSKGLGPGLGTSRLPLATLIAPLQHPLPPTPFPPPHPPGQQDHARVAGLRRPRQRHRGGRLRRCNHRKRGLPAGADGPGAGGDFEGVGGGLGQAVRLGGRRQLACAAKSWCDHCSEGRTDLTARLMSIACLPFLLRRRLRAASAARC